MVAMSLPTRVGPARPSKPETERVRSPMQYDVEQVMVDQDELAARVFGLERTNLVQSFQLILLAAYIIFSRRS